MRIYRNIFKILLWAAFCLLLLFALPRANAQSVTEGALKFQLLYGGKSYELVSCDKTAIGEIVIPATVNDLPVTQIGTSAFYGCAELTAITLPDTVTHIYPSAFGECAKLQNIVIPDSVTVIYNAAFQNCTALTGVTIGKGVTHIEKAAFSGCVSLTGIVIPDNVVSLGYLVFDGCTALTDITLSNNLNMDDVWFFGCDNLTYNLYNNGKYLGSTDNPYFVLVDTVSDTITQCQIHPDTKILYPQAFADCALLTDITIPDGVEIIGAGTFSRCANLKTITIGKGTSTIANNFTFGCIHLTGFWISESNPKYCSDAHGILFNKDMTALLKVPQTFSGNYTVPDSVTTIHPSAFYDCDGLTYVTIGKQVTEIGNYAFGQCDLLSGIWVAADNPTYKSDSSGVLFNKHNNMLLQAPGALCGEYAIAEGVKTIAPDAFAGCGQLISVTFPNTVTYISDGAFSNCTGLTGIAIPAGIITIAQDTFAGCTGLTEVVIPNTVGNISLDAFARCTSLKTVSFTGSQTKWNTVDIADGNDAVKNAELVLNYKGTTPTQSTTAPTTAPTTVPTTAPTTVPTTAPTTVPATAPTTVPVTVPSAAPVEGGDSHSNTWLFGALGFLVLAAGSMVTFIIYKKKKA